MKRFLKLRNTRVELHNIFELHKKSQRVKRKKFQQLHLVTLKNGLEERRQTKHSIGTTSNKGNSVRLIGRKLRMAYSQRNFFAFTAQNYSSHKCTQTQQFIEIYHCFGLVSLFFDHLLSL